MAVKRQTPKDPRRVAVEGGKAATKTTRQEARLQLVPREDEVVVRFVEQTSTGGGILLPAKQEAEPRLAVVVAVSAGYRASDGSLIAIDLKEGDDVLVRATRGARFRVPGQSGKLDLWHVSCHDIVLKFVTVRVDVPVAKAGR